MATVALTAALFGAAALQVSRADEHDEHFLRFAPLLSRDPSSFSTPSPTVASEPFPTPVPCQVSTQLTLIGIDVFPGSHHRARILLTITSPDGVIAGAKVDLVLYRSDGFYEDLQVETDSSGEAQFEMTTTSYGINEVRIIYVATLGDSFFPGDCDESGHAGQASLIWTSQ